MGLSPVLFLADTLRDAADPQEARQAAAALSTLAWAAVEANQLAAEIMVDGRMPPKAELVRDYFESYARDAESIARLVWAGDRRLRVSPVDYLAWLLPRCTGWRAGSVVWNLGLLCDAVVELISIAADLREIGESGAPPERAVAAEIADRIAAAADKLGASWLEED